MPNWKVHLEIGKKINEQLKYTNDELALLLFGSILPDVNNGYIVENISKRLPHDTTHYTEYIYKGFEKFCEKYSEEVKVEPLFKGYVAHLITDFFWNNYFYTDFYKVHTQLNGMTEEELRILKQGDFRIYDDNYYKNIIICNNVELLTAKAKDIEEISINNGDTEKVLEYLKEKANIEPPKQEFKIMKKEELDKLMNDTVIYILKFFKENNY